tara:strand:- start:32 stop:379 length:348 start_codon:yes stop_codon:yes gene_type:complete
VLSFPQQPAELPNLKYNVAPDPYGPNQNQSDALDVSSFRLTKSPFELLHAVGLAQIPNDPLVLGKSVNGTDIPFAPVPAVLFESTPPYAEEYVKSLIVATTPLLLKSLNVVPEPE